MKMRMGIDDDHMTYLEAGKIAEDLGVSAVALHARTAAQHYSGQARWDAIKNLKEHVTTIPVLGNGDIWSAEDALNMVAHTGCDGVVVGRGCQGRPWLFADLTAAFAGRDERVTPGLGYVAETIYRHGEYLVEFFGDEGRGLRDLRKHMAWYLKGYAVGGEARQALALVDSLADLRRKLDELDHDAPYPGKLLKGSAAEQEARSARFCRMGGLTHASSVTSSASHSRKQSCPFPEARCAERRVASGYFRCCECQE